MITSLRLLIVRFIPVPEVVIPLIPSMVTWPDELGDADPVLPIILRGDP